MNFGEIIMSETKKILLIGCGYWGKNWYNTLKKSSKNIVGVVDPNPIIKIGFVPVFDDISDVDIEYTHVILAVPPKYVLDILDKLKVPKENILVEKPGCVSFDSVKKLDGTFPGFIFLHSLEYDYIKTNLDKIGKPLLYYSNRSSMGPRIRTDVSILEDYLIHDLYIFIDLFGVKNMNINSVEFLNNFNSPIMSDTISLNFKSNNVVANMFSSWRFPLKYRDVIIVGENGSFIWKNNNLFFNDVKYTEIEGTDDFGNVNYMLESGKNIPIAFEEDEYKRLDINTPLTFGKPSKTIKSNLELELDSFVNAEDITTNFLDVWKVINKIKETNEKSTTR